MLSARIANLHSKDVVCPESTKRTFLGIAAAGQDFGMHEYHRIFFGDSVKETSALGRGVKHDDAKVTNR